jgi:uncharacterized protein YneF (UPF0154 family)
MVWTTVVQFLAGAVMGFFLLATAFRQNLAPTHPPIQGVRGAISLG